MLYDNRLSFSIMAFALQATLYVYFPLKSNPFPSVLPTPIISPCILQVNVYDTSSAITSIVIPSSSRIQNTSNSNSSLSRFKNRLIASSVCISNFSFFRTGYDIPSLQPLMEFIDCHGLGFKIKVRWCQSKLFTFTNPAPIKQFKRLIGNILIHHGYSEFHIFFLYPEQHFFAFFHAHRSRFFRRIDIQNIIANRMVEDGAQLSMNGFQISWRSRLSCLSLLTSHLILPINHILCRNLR